MGHGKLMKMTSFCKKDKNSKKNVNRVKRKSYDVVTTDVMKILSQHQGKAARSGAWNGRQR